MRRIEPVFLFDLDGTLVDSVYQHVLSWKEALDAENIELSVWRIHRKIGMSGGLFTNQLLRETGLDISIERVERLRRRHADAYRRQAASIRPLPGARELLAWLTSAQIPWAIATSGRLETAAANLEALGVDPARVPVVTRDQVKYAKPDPDLFLAAAERLNTPIETSVVVGDSIWDMLAAARSRALGVGLLCGGMARRSFSVLAPCAFMRIPAISSFTSMKSAVVAEPGGHSTPPFPPAVHGSDDRDRAGARRGSLHRGRAGACRLTRAPRSLSRN
jgi:HAD superfamily hydrolase (TIGR01509 family)